MRILIIKLSSIGDVVHTLPALFALRKRFPDAEIDWLTEGPSESLLKHHPLIDNLLIFRKDDLKRNPFSLKNLREMLKLVGNLRRRRYDLVCDFQGLFKSGIFAFLSGGRRRLGFDGTREFSYIFLNERLPPYDPDIHAVERYMEIPSSLGAHCEIKFTIPILKKDRDRVDSLLNSYGVLKKDRMVLINPWARWESKLWDKRAFALLCNEIIDRYGFKVILVGDKEAVGYNNEILSLCKGGVINLTGLTNLRELAYLMSLAISLITLDSAPMHIASAMGTKVVALFGPTSPKRTGPYGEGHVVIRKGLACSPCFLRRCKGMECMKDIKVEDIIVGLDKIIKNQQFENRG